VDQSEENENFFLALLAGIQFLNCTNLVSWLSQKYLKSLLSDFIFMITMYWIRFRLGLCPRLRWKSSQHSPQVSRLKF